MQSIEFRVAKDFIERYEWLGHIGAAKYCFGLLSGAALRSVVCYTSPAAPLAFSRLLGEDVGPRVLQLSRGASAPGGPSNAASRLICWSLRHIRSRFGTNAVVAFADPRAGEVGVIYQASNALYLGLTDSRGPGEYIIRGRRYHARAVQKHFGSAAHDNLLKLDPAYKRIQRTRKHRYLFVLARGSERQRLLRAVRHLIRPFPRRDNRMTD
jgi:hypothetical protein